MKIKSKIRTFSHCFCEKNISGSVTMYSLTCRPAKCSEFFPSNTEYLLLYMYTVMFMMFGLCSFLFFLLSLHFNQTKKKGT